MKNTMGATKTVTSYILGESNTPGLFNPYKSGSDFHERATSIVTAPIYTALESLSIALGSVNLILHSITQLVIFVDPMKALSMFADALLMLVIAAEYALRAILSPIINAVDLIGSGIATLMQDNGAQPTC